MKINIHAHVFNFSSILTKETILLLSHRLTGRNLPEPLRDALLSYLRARRKTRPGDISFDDFHRTMRGTRFFDRLIPQRLSTFFDRHLDLPPSSETTAALTSLLEATLIDRHQASSTQVINAFEWLRIGFMKRIDDVTDDLIAHMDDDDVAVVLPMDILDRKAGKRERALFLDQLEDTKRQALRYPGRILPFVKVNPVRRDSFHIMRDALHSGACVGLKLYPSLGYSLEGSIMKDTLLYCDKESVPVLQHCNDKGFRKSAKDAQYCDPRAWIPVLDTHHTLKICFAHFGGQSQEDKPVWTAPDLPRDSWAVAILELMERYPGRVFADISYHAEQNATPEATQNYKKNLIKVLSDDRYRDHVLWGTDFHLLRMDANDSDYATGFRDLIGDELFTRISRHNPATYLGLPVDGRAAEANILRHIKWLATHHARAVHGTPALWLREHPEGASIRGGGRLASPEGPAWDSNNRIHTSVFNFLWNNRQPAYLSDRMKRHLRSHGETPEALFEAVGRLPVGELAFHGDVLGDRTDRDHAIRSFSNRIHVQFSAISSFEKKTAHDSAYLLKMVTACSDPSVTVPKIAEVMELFFRVKNELEVES
jgi:predicted TIM-barrel fold metal-dependent hydrolase